jgi:hypothetical protein
VNIPSIANPRGGMVFTVVAIVQLDSEAELFKLAEEAKKSTGPAGMTIVQ